MRTLNIEQRSKIEGIIKSCKTCYLAMSEGTRPYIIPMNFGLKDNMVILHSAQNGRMWDTLKTNPRVCINWTAGEELAWQDVRVGCSYRVKSFSALIEGVAEIVDDYSEKEKCLEIIMAQYSDRRFKFNPPAVKNVGIIKVHIEKLSAREFGAKPLKPWNRVKTERKQI